MDAICTADEFVGHKDPYTGEPLAIRLYVFPKGVTRYRIENGYDVSTLYPDMETATSMWSRKDGVMGLRDPSVDGFTCAWTGKRLTPMETDGQHGFSGGFCTRLFRTREDLLDALAKMEGTSVQHERESRIEAVCETPPPPKYHEHDLSDDTLGRAESLVETAKRVLGVAPATPVSMSVPKKPRRAQ